MLATCTAKMAGKVTVGIEDEGKLQQESWRWVCKKKERSNKKTKAAGFATASTPCRNIPMRILLKLCFIVNTNGSFSGSLCNASRIFFRCMSDMCLI
ncbi:hypothetical protein V6N13_047100 [Hibiscus sabdariffa]